MQKSINKKYFIFVIGTGMKNFTATLYFFKNINNKFILIDKSLCYVGANGWGRRSDIKGKAFTKAKNYKKEGDLKTPIGLFILGRMFSHDIKKKTKNRKEPGDNPNLYCYEDLNEVYECCYSGSPVGNRRNRQESMTNPLYKRAIFINYNHPLKNKKAGSCIFLHVGQKKTAGCVAVDFKMVDKIFQSISPNTALILMIPSKNYLKYFPRFTFLKKVI